MLLEIDIQASDGSVLKEALAQVYLDEAVEFPAFCLQCELERRGRKVHMLRCVHLIDLACRIAALTLGIPEEEFMERMRDNERFHRAWIEQVIAAKPDARHLPRWGDVFAIMRNRLFMGARSPLR
jgi:hypothetical protein